MCGRFALYSSFAAIKEYADILFKIGKLDPNYNIAPGQIIPTIVQNRKGENLLEPCKWGLVPFWAKDPKIGYKMINARAETIAEKPSYRAAFKYRRCLIPANGFYEWRRPDKQPFFIKLKSRELFTFAGLWEDWSSDDGSQMRTCSIITTEPNKYMQQIHNRMPAILPRDKERDWLQLNDKGQLRELLHPYDAADMDMYEVTKAVNSYKNNGPELINRLVGW
jgi:putative SOS response-associated peptidase YedK